MEEAAKKFPLLATDLQGIDEIYWPNFKWLADENLKWIGRQVHTEVT